MNTLKNIYSYKYKDGYLIYNREKNKIIYTDRLNSSIDEEKSDENYNSSEYNHYNDNLNHIKNKGLIEITYISTPHCNLKCKYCYENNTLLQNKLEVMSAKQHYDIFNSIKEYFSDQIKFRISFFGGEPFLAKNQIFEFVKMLETDSKKYKTEMPSLITITNGTLFDSEARKFVHHYFNGITFSIDGTKILHDTNRLYKNGAGSFDDVINNVSEFNKINSDQKVSTACEVTLTDAYFKNYNSKLMKEVWELLKELKFEKVEFIPVDDINSKLITKAENIDVITKDLVDLWYDDIVNNSNNIKVLNLMNYLLLFIANKSKGDGVCGGGYNKFAIDANYNVYPCQMSLFAKNNIIGKISNSKLQLNHDISKKYLTKKTHPLCKNCECVKGCSSYCRIFMNDETETISLGCLFNKKIFEHSLIKIVEIMNSDKKENFINGTKLLFNA